MKTPKQTPKITISYNIFNESLFYSYKRIEIDPSGPSAVSTDDSYVESGLTRDQLSQVIKI